MKVVHRWSLRFDVMDSDRGGPTIVAGRGREEGTLKPVDAKTACEHRRCCVPMMYFSSMEGRRKSVRGATPTVCERWCREVGSRREGDDGRDAEVEMVATDVWVRQRPLLVDRSGSGGVCRE